MRKYYKLAAFWMLYYLLFSLFTLPIKFSQMSSCGSLEGCGPISLDETISRYITEHYGQVVLEAILSFIVVYVVFSLVNFFTKTSYLSMLKNMFIFYISLVLLFSILNPIIGAQLKTDNLKSLESSLEEKYDTKLNLYQYKLSFGFFRTRYSQSNDLFLNFRSPWNLVRNLYVTTENGLEIEKPLKNRAQYERLFQELKNENALPKNIQLSCEGFNSNECLIQIDKNGEIKGLYLKKIYNPKGNDGLKKDPQLEDDLGTQVIPTNYSFHEYIFHPFPEKYHKKADYLASIEQFEKLKNGTSYNDVVTLMNGKPAVIELPYIENIQTAIFIYNLKGEGWGELTFENGYLSSKKLVTLDDLGEWTFKERWKSYNSVYIER